MRTKHWLFVLILISAVFLRSYNFAEYYIFDHDQDLYSWIVKDIVIDGHVRLIGQETSIDGLFIGPLFYYLLVPFYWIGRMNPLAALFPALLLSAATLISLYWVTGRLYGKKLALIASTLYAFSLGIIMYDRWIVPSLPTLLWSVWFFYLVTQASQKKINWILMGILLGLIWHIHIALLPLFLMIPILGWKAPLKLDRNFWLGVGLGGILIAPFLLFEMRHQFQQTWGVVNSIGLERGEVKGLPRVLKAFDAFSRMQLNMFIPDYSSLVPQIYALAEGVAVLVMAFFSPIRKIVLLWVGIVLIAQILTTRAISEYYFANIWILTILLVSFLLARSRLAIIGLIIFVLFNSYLVVTRPPLANSYARKSEVIAYLEKDARDHRYPCIGINYISEFGTHVGYRYLAWKQNLHLVQPADGVAVYSIVSPWERSPQETKDHRYGGIGIIPATPTDVQPEQCTNPSNQLLPLLGFTK